MYIIRVCLMNEMKIRDDYSTREIMSEFMSRVQMMIMIVITLRLLHVVIIVNMINKYKAREVYVNK